MLQVSINDKTFSLPAGTTILKGLKSIGLDIPSICNDDRIAAYGGCRLCLVKIEGINRLQTACNTELSNGMKIFTHSSEIESLRKDLLRMLASNYPKDSVALQPEKEFNKILRQYGIDMNTKELTHNPVNKTVDDSHPTIRVDMSKCIYCFRCVRICNELQGQFTWAVIKRGSETKIVPDSGTTFGESSCVACGACSDSCPTGAIDDKSPLLLGLPTKWTKTTCLYCGVGCEMMAGTTNDKISQILPSLDSPVNKGHLCTKGRYAFEFVDSPDRVTTPLIRELRERGSQWREVSWDEAIKYTAKKFKDLIDKHGSDNIGVVGSARGTNEENYVTQKFTRLVLGTNNVDNCARVCHSPSAAALKKMLGTGAATNSFSDIEYAKTFLICGTNTTECHPIVGARIKQQVLKGANLIVIDPRKIELAHYADIHLNIKPGTNIPLLNAIAHTIINEGLIDSEFVEDRVNKFKEFSSFIERWTPKLAGKICGIDPSMIKDAAILYAEQKPSISFHGLGLTEHIQGTETVMALINLALITGNMGKRGTGINPLRGQNNVQGVGNMGCMPNILTGGISIEEGKGLHEKLWKGKIPKSKGQNILQLLDRSREGKLNGLYLIGYDVFLTMPNSKEIGDAFKNLELVVIQDLFMTETGKKFGTIFLPASSGFEKEGTFMNSERRVQMVNKIVKERGASKTDWEILSLLASAMGHKDGFSFKNSEEIWNEVRELWPDASGISYARINEHGIQWPCKTGDDNGTEILHKDAFKIGKKAALESIDFRPTTEKTSKQYPFTLITGRNLFLFNAGTMSLRSSIESFHPFDVLEISPQDAKKYKLKNGEKLKISSHYGETTISAEISDRVNPGELFSTFTSPDIFINQITSSHRDNHVGTPEYKVTAVSIEKL